MKRFLSMFFFRLLLIAFFVALPITVNAQSQSFKNCTYDYLKFCSAYSISSDEGKNCMRRHGPRLSDRCITALVNDGLITKDEVFDIAEDSGITIIETDDGFKKVANVINPPEPERNPQRETQIAQAETPPVTEPEPAPVPEPKPEEITPVPPPETEPAPPVPEKAPEPPKEDDGKSILEKAIEVIKKGYEKDPFRKPGSETVQPKAPAPKVSEPKPKVASKPTHIRQKSYTAKKKVVQRKTQKTKRTVYKKKANRNRKYSVRAQDRRRNKRLHGFDSDFIITPGGYGSNFQFTERFRIQNR